MPHVTIDNASQLRDLFRDYDRHNQFSYQGFEWLYDWLEEYEEATGRLLSIDVIGLCCDFSEESYETIASEYSIDLPPREDYMETDDEDEPLPDTFNEDAYNDALRETVIDYLHDNTSVAGYDDDSVLYVNF